MFIGINLLSWGLGTHASEVRTFSLALRIIQTSSGLETVCLGFIVKSLRRVSKLRGEGCGSKIFVGDERRLGGPLIGMTLMQHNVRPGSRVRLISSSGFNVR